MSNPVTTSPAPVFGIVKKRTRFFGLTVDECIQTFFGGNAIVASAIYIASALGVSEDTVRRDWRLAKAWLRRFLDEGSSHEP